MAKTKEELREARKQWLPTATTFSPRDSLSNLSSSNSDATRQSRSKLQFALAASSFNSPLGLPKEFAPMEQKLQEMHTKEDDSLFYYHSSEVFNPCIIAVPSLEGL